MPQVQKLEQAVLHCIAVHNVHLVTRFAVAEGFIEDASGKKPFRMPVRRGVHLKPGSAYRIKFFAPARGSRILLHAEFLNDLAVSDFNNRYRLSAVAPFSNIFGISHGLENVSLGKYISVSRVAINRFLKESRKRILDNESGVSHGQSLSLYGR